MPAPLIGSAEDGLAEALFDLASVVNQPETTDLALLYDRCALDLRPHLAVAQLLLADILSGQNKPQESLDVLCRNPGELALCVVGAAARAPPISKTLGRIDEAVAELRAMAAKEPDRAGAEIQLGDLLRGQKRFSEAADAYSEAIRRLKAAGTTPHWALYYSRGIAYERSGQWSLAEADLEHALELKPDQPLVLNYLGYSWIDRGEKLKRGLKMIEKAVALRPEDGYIVDSLGWAHYRLGDYAERGRIPRKGAGAGARRSDDQRSSGRRLLEERADDSKPAINGGRRCSSSPTRKTSSRSRPSSKAGCRASPPRRGPAAAERRWRSRPLPRQRSIFTCMLSAGGRTAIICSTASSPLPISATASPPARQRR